MHHELAKDEIYNSVGSLKIAMAFYLKHSGQNEAFFGCIDISQIACSLVIRFRSNSLLFGNVGLGQIACSLVMLI